MPGGSAFLSTNPPILEPAELEDLIDSGLGTEDIVGTLNLKH
jgi:hypothetical protein